MEEKLKKMTKNKKDMHEVKKIRWSVSGAISVIFEKVQNSKMRFRKSEKYNEAMERLCAYFGTNETQTLILCIIFALHFETPEATWDLSDLRREIGCSALKTVSWPAEIAELRKRHFLNSSRGTCFYPSEQLMSAISANEEIVIDESEFLIDFSKFVSNVADMVENRESDNISPHRLARNVTTYESENSGLPIVKSARLILTETQDRIFFYDACSDYLKREDTSLQATIRDIYSNHERYAVAETFIRETNPLLALGLLEFTVKGNMRDSELTLTEKGIEILAGEQKDLFVKKIDEKLLIKPEKIKKKTLFYSKENQEQIDILKNALSEEKLGEIQKRLKEEAMPVGVAVLLYGSPGTGKTESVFQIARETGRPVVHVDISDTKSCWFGESEKKIKELFRNYARMCESASKSSDGKTPILLFNEADAVFARRKSNATSSVDQTENAMQNIILEEMENLEGIMVATTNFADNLDPAFERRFLFKIQFENPSFEAKKSIWLSKLAWLSEKDAESFAQKYEFSGGQIDNIVRKITMQEVITGKRPEIPEIEDMCRVEKLCKDSGRKMGFCA